MQQSRSCGVTPTDPTALGKGSDSPGDLARMNGQITLCYLCDRPLSEPIGMDHVPMQQLYPPDVRKAHSQNLLTIPVHRELILNYFRAQKLISTALSGFVPLFRQSARE
jgi:hypothetical protein